MDGNLRHVSVAKMPLSLASAWLKTTCLFDLFGWRSVLKDFYT